MLLLNLFHCRKHRQHFAVTGFGMLLRVLGEYVRVARVIGVSFDFFVDYVDADNSAHSRLPLERSVYVIMQKRS